MRYYIQKLIRWWVERLIARHEREGVKPIQLIESHRAGSSSVYMVRYIAARDSLLVTLATWGKYQGVYIHRLLRSDLDTYHDHPWDFWGLMVSGRYSEHSPRPDKWVVLPTFSLVDQVTVRSCDENTLAFRKAESLHWIELDREYTYEERAQAPTTICLIGRRRRVWGFLDKMNGAWIPWTVYLKVDGVAASAPSNAVKPSGENNG